MNAPDITTRDPLAQVAHAFRVDEAQDAGREFWTKRQRDLAGNHQALWCTAYVVLRALELGVPPSAASLRRLREAIEAKEAIDAVLTAHLNGSREC